MPAAAITSASPSLAQHIPTAPASIWSRATRGDLCALACGRQATPASAQSSAMRARLRSNASASTKSTGVSSSAIFIL